MELSENTRLIKAQKRVEALKGFYSHLFSYLIINIVLFILRGNVLDFFQSASPDKNFVEWVNWNILLVPIFWGIGLLYHAAKVFQYKFGFIRKWEQRQLEKFISEEEFRNFKN